MLKKIFLFLLDTILAITAFGLVVFLFVLKFDKIYAGIGLGCIIAYVLFIILRSTHSDNYIDRSGAKKIGNNKQSFSNHSNAEKNTKSTHSDNHFDGSGAKKIGNNKQSYFNHPNAEKHTKMMISNIIVKNANTCLIYGIEGGRNKLLGTGSIKGKLVGWGEDFYVTDYNGDVRTWDAQGQRIGNTSYNPSYYHFGNVGGNMFCLVSNTNQYVTKMYDRKCKPIH